MTNEVLLNDAAKQQLKKGVDIVCNAVKVTLGPQGRNVIINKGNNPPHITKDGVTVAKEIYLNDPYEMMGANLIKNIASKTCDDSGDGCQPLYSKIYTPNGYIKMGDVKIGDEICGTNNTIQKVIGVFPQGERKTYKIKFNNERETICCGSHLWTVKNDIGEIDTLKTLELIKNFSIHKYTTPGFYDNKDNRDIKDYLFNDVILGIEETGNYEFVQCIKVSNPDELYITDDYIVTHNTTSSCVLAQSIINNGYYVIKTKHANPIALKSGIEKASKIVVDFIKKSSIKINDNPEATQAVATISANNDEFIGKLISDAINYVGEYGAVTVEKSNNIDTTISSTDGFRVAQRGYLSPYFITNESKGECVLEDAYIYITDRKLTKTSDVLPLLNAVAGDNKSLFIIAEEVSEDALSALVLNKLQAGIRVCAIKGPEFGHNRKDNMVDIATLCGGTMDSIMEDGAFGYASKIIVKKENTIIIGAKGDKELIDKRFNELVDLKNNTTTDFEIKLLNERLSRFSNGVSVLNIGAKTEIELNEKLDRVDDALNATRAAIEEGVVPGGGVIFLKAKDQLLKNKYKFSKEELFGFDVMMESLNSPIYQILLNAGVDNVEDIIDQILDKKSLFYGYNAKKYTYGNLFKQGVIDPAKVLRVALENAVSVSNLFLTTECAIISQ